jgi:hypothetical protein
MAPTTPLVAANVALKTTNGSVAAATPYTIVAGDVTNGLSIPQSLFAGAISGLNFGQTGFVLERIELVVTTTTPGTAFSVIVKATQPQTDVPNEAVPFPLANAGDSAALNVNANGTYYIGPLTSGRFSQPDQSLLLNFSGTLGVTTLWVLATPWAPAGPRG